MKTRRRKWNLKTLRDRVVNGRYARKKHFGLQPGAFGKQTPKN